jgi:hypothetical protein
VKSRLGATVAGREVETDREYALVVDEEALRAPPTDAHTGRQFADDRAIREAIRAQSFDEAFEAYRRSIEAQGTVEFRSDLERALSEHYLRRRDFARATTVLEHHVATHARQEIDPEVYLNLGYAHIQTRTFNKSKRFLRLFVETSTRADHIARAQAILDSLGSN